MTAAKPAGVMAVSGAVAGLLCMGTGGQVVVNASGYANLAAVILALVFGGGLLIADKVSGAPILDDYSAGKKPTKRSLATVAGIVFGLFVGAQMTQYAVRHVPGGQGLVRWENINLEGQTPVPVAQLPAHVVIAGTGINPRP